MSSARMLAARWYVVLLLLLVHHCECQQEVHPSLAHVDNPLIPAAMQLITEYAIWRKLDHILIFDSYLRPGIHSPIYIPCMSDSELCKIETNMQYGKVFKYVGNYLYKHMYLFTLCLVTMMSCTYV